MCRTSAPTGQTVARGTSGSHMSGSAPISPTVPACYRADSETAGWGRSHQGAGGGGLPGTPTTDTKRRVWNGARQHRARSSPDPLWLPGRLVRSAHVRVVPVGRLCGRGAPWVRSGGGTAQCPRSRWTATDCDPAASHASSPTPNPAHEPGTCQAAGNGMTLPVNAVVGTTQAWAYTKQSSSTTGWVSGSPGRHRGRTVDHG